MPYFKYLDWVNEFLPNVDSELQSIVFLAYRQMLAGTALSSMFSGRRYKVVRQIMVSHDVARLTNDYVPLTAPAPSPRVLPVGEHIVFDIYSRNRYVRRNKEYTVQIRFDVWFPLGVIRKNKYGEQLLALFFPIADALFRRINVGASIEDMVESQELDFTVGVVKREKDVIRNLSTWSIIITKYETSKVTSYPYDFIVKYRWTFDDLGGGVYNADMCYLQILMARSCTTNINLYESYNRTYTEYTGQPYPYDKYHIIFNTCDFTFNYLRPTKVPLCRATVDAKIFRPPRSSEVSSG